MGFEFDGHLGEADRSVSALERDGKTVYAVIISRSFATTIDVLWDAITQSELIPLWFLPVSGDLRLGGRYQLEGNAGGTVTECTRPTHLALTWEYAGDVSWVEGHVSDEGDGQVRLKLSHTARVSPFWDQYGPGAAGVGWEMFLLGLALYLAQPNKPKIDEDEFAGSPEGKAFIAGSSKGWEQASLAFGTDPDAAEAAAKRTTGFYSKE